MKVMTPPIESTKRLLRKHLSDCQIEKVFTILESGIIDNGISNQIAVIKFRYNRIAQDSRQNIISHDTQEIANAKIATDILSIIDLINEKNFCDKSVSCKGKKIITLKIEAEIDYNDEEELMRIIAKLMKLSGDNSLKIDKVKRGSIILEISLSEEAHKNLMSAYASGELSKVLNYANVQIINNETRRSSKGGKGSEKIFNDYFETVHSVAVEYYPYDADNLTVEIFNKRIFPAVDTGILKQENDNTTTIIKLAVDWCIKKRFEEIYEHYFPLVYGIASRYSYINADDVTQDIFVDKILPAIKKKRFIEEKVKVYKGFIKKIAINQCNTAYNRSKYHTTESIDFLPPDMSVVPSSIDPMFLLGLALEDRLSRREYIVTVMTIEGYSDEEIAKELASTVTAVRQVRYRVRKKLR